MILYTSTAILLIKKWRKGFGVKECVPTCDHSGNIGEALVFIDNEDSFIIKTKHFI